MKVLRKMKWALPLALVWLTVMGLAFPLSIIPDINTYLALLVECGRHDRIMEA